VDVRGGAPGTRETDLLSPVNLVEKVHAVLFSGGSAFGLDAASGVMKYLEERKIGLTGAGRVPIALQPSFDLNLGQKSAGCRMGFASICAWCGQK
jgi:L-aminopeptidase/D-esterase-like protein